MKIVLLGYMASGKTTVGKILAEKINFEFIDLDHYIELNEQATVSELFKKKGEIYFRKIESTYLKSILESNKNIVLALGGGTPCYGNNIKLINDAISCVSIYLQASVVTLSARLLKSKNTRPLIAHLNTKPKLMEFVGKHLFEREYYYRQSNFIVNTDGKTNCEIVEEMVFKLFQVGL
jgi:shikimate kinase